MEIIFPEFIFFKPFDPNLDFGVGTRNRGKSEAAGSRINFKVARSPVDEI